MAYCINQMIFIKPHYLYSFIFNFSKISNLIYFFAIVIGNQRISCYF